MFGHGDIRVILLVHRVSSTDYYKDLKIIENMVKLRDNTNLDHQFIASLLRQF